MFGGAQLSRGGFGRGACYSRTSRLWRVRKWKGSDEAGGRRREIIIEARTTCPHSSRRKDGWIEVVGKVANVRSRTTCKCSVSRRHRQRINHFVRVKVHCRSISNSARRRRLAERFHWFFIDFSRSSFPRSFAPLFQYFTTLRRCAASISTITIQPLTAWVLQSMNPSAAFPKAAALPARLLRTQQCSAQTSICSSGQKRGYHAPASASPARRLREGVYKKKAPVGPSVRVGSFSYWSVSLNVIDICLFIGLPQYFPSLGNP